MQIDYNYLNNEIRDGFFVSSMMKKTWASQLKVLEDLDKVCQKNNIKYFLDCGTLLGCIRHGGYIPWDDDLDVCMFREDFERFRKEVVKQMPANYELLNFHDDPEYKLFLNRLVNTKVINFNTEHLENNYGFPYVSGLDIFPVDYLPDSEEERAKLIDNLHEIGSCVQLFFDNKLSYRERNEIISLMETKYKIKIDRNKNIYNQFNILAEKIMASYPSEGKEVAITSIWMNHPDNKFDTKFYKHIIYMPFENISAPVPYMYDELLERKYHNYMKQVRAWDTHDFPYYKKQEEAYIENKGFAFGKYNFDKNDLVRADVNDIESVSEKTNNYIDLLKRINNTLLKLTNNGEIESINNLLEKGQEIAISFGTYIENQRIIKYSPIISDLERYCELIYEFSLFLMGEIDKELTDIYLEMIGLVNSLNEKFNSFDVSDNKKIAFLFEKENEWDKFSSIYNVLSDENYSKYIIPVPTYEYTFTYQQGEEHYIGDKFKDNPDFVDYKEFDFNSIVFDVIFVCNPYEKENVSQSIHRAFYYDNLQKIAKKIVYVPCLEPDEFEMRDERLVTMMDYYVKMPGLVKADCILVDSDNKREQYIYALTEMAGEDTRTIWADKVISYEKTSIPEEIFGIKINMVSEKSEQPNNKVQKRILYYTNVSKFLEKGKLKVEKIRKNFEVFKEYDNQVEIIWCMGEEYYQIKEIDKEVYDQIVCIMKEFEKIFGRKVIDVNKDIYSILDECDAYFGDCGVFVNEFVKKQKPVMIERLY